MADFSVIPFFGEPAMEFTDRILKCIDCGAEFMFTAGEQLFFHDKQFTNDPKHCKQCKAKRVRGGSRVRPETRTTCSQCGEATTVPFKPTQGRPVLCRVCFKQQRTAVEQTREDDAKSGAASRPAAEATTGLD
jgi:CxxC-x17-CxxC domain-containing protein